MAPRHWPQCRHDARGAASALVLSQLSDCVHCQKLHAKLCLDHSQVPKPLPSVGEGAQWAAAARAVWPPTWACHSSPLGVVELTTKFASYSSHEAATAHASGNEVLIAREARIGGIARTPSGNAQPWIRQSGRETLPTVPVARRTHIGRVAGERADEHASREGMTPLLGNRSCQLTTATLQQDRYGLRSSTLGLTDPARAGVEPYCHPSVIP
jgi:hypothetical protein